MGWNSRFSSREACSGRARVGEVRLGQWGRWSRMGGHTWGMVRRQKQQDWGGGWAIRGKGNWEGEGRSSFEDNLRLKDRQDSGISTNEDRLWLRWAGH